MFSAGTIALITRAAREADLEPAVLLAVAEVESGGRTHALIKGRTEPLIRFEGHYFDRRLSEADRIRARREGLAAPAAGAVRNPPGQAARWRMLESAAAIDRRAAYESTSWGVGQVMGAHWAWLGYRNVDALVAEARSGLEGQLRLMLRYIEKAGLKDALRERNWVAFARGYNGPDYARNSYHLRLALAYRRHARLAEARAREGEAMLMQGDSGSAVRQLQSTLSRLGHRVAIDGIFGPETDAALRAFQRRHGLSADGIVGPRTSAALREALQPAGIAGRLSGAIAAFLQRILAAFR